MRESGLSHTDSLCSSGKRQGFGDSEKAFGISISAAAQASYPDQPIRLVVPFSAGGGNDIVARLLAKSLSQRLKISIIVENRPGAGGNIGMGSVARATPGGYTLVYVANTVVINPYLYKKLSFDITHDFSPIGLVATTPMWVLANPAFPIRTMGELVTYAKANPDKLSYATPGVGTPHHVAAELLKTRAGIQMIHIPYKGASGAAADVIGGQVPILIATPASAEEFVTAGKLRAIASMDSKRSQTMPQLPTVAETIPGFAVSIWHGIMPPAKTDEAVISKLSAALKGALEDPVLMKELEAVRFTPAFSTPDQMRERINSELKIWADVTKQAGIQAD